MCEANVLDTGVMLGVTIEKDSHHELCFDYVTNGEPCYVSPTVRTEYERKKTGIREDLNQEIVEHRGAFVEEVESDPLTPSAIEWVCAELLDRDMKSFRYLNKYYQKKRDESRVRPIQKVEVEMDLEEMGMEVWEDAAEDKGGAESFFIDWDKGIESYPDVQRNLLIHEGDDPQVCLEAHHIAICLDSPTEIGTTNSTHFIDKHGNEPVSREENILEVTRLESVCDLAWHGRI